MNAIKKWYFEKSSIFPITNYADNPRLSDMEFKLSFMKVMVLGINTLAMTGMLTGQVYGLLEYLLLLIGTRVVYSIEGEVMHGVKGLVFVIVIPLLYGMLLWGL